MTTISPEEFKARMGQLFNPAEYDEEIAHCDADKLMCDLLRQIGYGEGIDIFEKSDKWYA